LSRGKNSAATGFVELIGTHERVDEYVIEFESDHQPTLRIQQLLLAAGDVSRVRVAPLRMPSGGGSER